MITELGHNGTENIHLHGIIWTNEALNEVEKVWQYGYMWKGKMINGKLHNYVNDQTINYMIKYVTKTDDKHTKYKSIILTSPGIGNNYTTNQKGDWKHNIYNDNKTNETYKTRTGHKIALPIYWRNKIYTEEQKEKLWLQKLDKQERWILGNKINVSNNETEYYKALEYAKQINNQLGYGNDNKDWNIEQYERQKRIIMQQTRIKKAEEKEFLRRLVFSKINKNAATAE